MPVGKEYFIDNLCKAGTREKFVEIVKEFMIATLSRYSYGIEFSGDYKKIRKSDITGLPDLLKKKWPDEYWPLVCSFETIPGAYW